MQHRWSDVRPPFTLWVSNTVSFINPDSACNIPEIREASSSLYNGQWQHLQTGWGTNRIAHGMGEASRDSRVGCFQFGIIHSDIWFTMNECIIIWATYSFWFPYQNTAEPATHVTATIWYRLFGWLNQKESKGVIVLSDLWVPVALTHSLIWFGNLTGSDFEWAFFTQLKTAKSRVRHPHRKTSWGGEGDCPKEVVAKEGCVIFMP